MSNAQPLGSRNPMYRRHVQDLIRVLGVGASNIQSSYEIARRIGVNQRALGYIVREARFDGHLVGSEHGKGYYLIQVREELDATLSHLEARIAGILNTVTAMRLAAKANGI